ncbi:DUF397 domain-containing protein [Streptomyces sp. BBFR2]|uniref:DUF397 domain-containing protein n=1 Tax=Streptomyces sp. BBFR2 TaxID=3372854 RepID=UPI0037D9A08C
MNSNSTDSLTWYKSSYSNENYACVEVAPDAPGVVPVRDSKAPEGPILSFPPNSFAQFVAGVKTGEFSA